MSKLNKIAIVKHMLKYLVISLKLYRVYKYKTKFKIKVTKDIIFFKYEERYKSFKLYILSIIIKICLSDKSTAKT